MAPLLCLLASEGRMAGDGAHRRRPDGTVDKIAQSLFIRVGVAGLSGARRTDLALCAGDAMAIEPKRAGVAEW
ncbi:MAG: hypothetical protein ABW164_07895 [Sphingobium sp.]